MWTVYSFQAGCVLFGQIGRLEWKLALPVGALVGILALGAWALVRVRRWRQEELDDSPVLNRDLVNHYQKMVEEGLLEHEELERIRARLKPPPHVSDPHQQPPPHPPSQASDS